MRSTSPEWTAEDILDSLNRVVEPAYRVTLVDLGVIYGVAVDGLDVTIEMTLPDPSPEAREAITRRIESVLGSRHRGLGEVRIAWVADPPWREDFITEDGRIQRENPLPEPVEATPDLVRDTLTHVIDPELGINIVDLGLVYGVGVSDRVATVTMTLTTPGCPLHSAIEAAVVRSVEIRHPDLAGVEVDLVWDPPWDTDFITPEGRARLGWGSRQRRGVAR